MKKIFILLFFMNFLIYFSSFFMEDDELEERFNALSVTGECKQEYEPDELEGVLYKGDLDTIKRIFSAKPGLIWNWRMEWGRNLLHTAAFWGHDNIIKFLVTICKFDVNNVNNDGFSVLHYAVLGNQLEAVKCLVSELRANASLRDKWRRTPLDYTQQENIKSIVLGENATAEDRKRLQAIECFLSKVQSGSLNGRGRSRSGSISYGDQPQRGRIRNRDNEPRRRSHSVSNTHNIFLLGLDEKQ